MSSEQGVTQRERSHPREAREVEAQDKCREPLSLLQGAYDDDLVDFFHVNTDVGAWDYGRRVAERVIAARGDRSALVVRLRR